ncbi:ABC transporter permease [Clostridium sp.]|jgi:putative ABC transport system permease protein|uniref:ABC transporter permease n=1 Tax=Clostridium sp. TaxID=1506 RepID=UPI003EEA28A7
MNIISSLTLRHMKLNKKRTIFTIIGVVLSVALITAVPTSVISFINMMQRNEIASTGNFHVLYKNMQRQNISKVMSDKNTSTAALSQDIGYAKLKGSKNENKPYLFIKSYDEQGFKDFNLNLVGGHFPKKSNEILISSHIAENGGVIYKVGDVLKLDIGQRYKDGNNVAIGQYYGFEKKSADNKGEKLITKVTKEYTITGIISRPGFEPYSSPGYTVISYLDKKELTPNETVNISVAWKHVSKKVNEQANKLSKVIGVTSNDVIYNSNLLRYFGIVSGDTLLTLYALAVIMTTIIVIGSAALICNSFAISISERSRHLGMLASVGATKKQKKNSVFFEGFVVGMIGIPIGILLGTLGIGITFILVQPLLGSILSTGVKLKLMTSPLVILVAILLSMITIFISSYIPAKRASKISPIDGIRQSRDIKLTDKIVKTSKLTRRIFGFEGELGLKNLKRNNRRYRATIISLVISIVLFLSVSSLSLLSQKSAKTIVNTVPYDVSLYVSSAATAKEKRDFYNSISKIKYADESVIEQTASSRLNAKSSLISDEIKALYKPDNNSDDTYQMNFVIKSIDDDSLKRYATQTEMDFNRLKDVANPRGILINMVTIKAHNKYERMKQFNIAEGEKLKLTHVINNEPTKYSTLLEIAALANKAPLGYPMLNNPTQPLLIVSEEVYASIHSKLPKTSEIGFARMYFKSSNPTKLIENIKEYQNKTSIGSVYIYDVASMNKRERQLMTFIYVFFYGFIAIITSICIANIFNTISTSITLRRQEFAMFKSVGMTPKSFNKMINYESLFYGIKSLLYGLPISFGIMYLIYRVLNDSSGVEFAIPWGSVIVTVTSVFAIVSSTMLYSSSKIRKENIIDALKTENI